MGKTLLPTAIGKGSKISYKFGYLNMVALFLPIRLVCPYHQGLSVPATLRAT